MPPKTPDADAPDEGAHNFATLIAKIDDGRLNGTCSDEIFALAQKLNDHALAHMRKATGRFTLTIDIAANEKGEVVLVPKTAIKFPMPPKTEVRMWMSPKGNLLTEHPRQTKLPLRQVGESAAPVRDVDTDEKKPAKNV